MTNPPTMTTTEPGRDDPADVWDAYCKEVPADRRSPQSALAFGFAARLSTPADQAVRSDLARELRDDYPAVDVTTVSFGSEFAGKPYCVIPQDRVLAVVRALDDQAVRQTIERETPAPDPCADLTVGQLIEWLDSPQYTNGFLDFEAANHMSAAAELLDRLIPERPAAIRSLTTEPKRS